MIVFQFDTETHVNDKPYSRTLYWLGMTEVTNEDKKHTPEIYEQLDAQISGLDDYDELDDWPWPYQRMSDGPEYSCPHGVGHSIDVHGCDGCCGHSSFKRRGNE